jgi:hypothetical protein
VGEYLAQDNEVLKQKNFISVGGKKKIVSKTK